MFGPFVVALLVSSASAFNVDSAASRKLLKASTLIEGRGLGNNNNNNNNNYNNNNAMYQVIGNLHLKYVGCANSYTVGDGKGGGGGGGNNKNGQQGSLIWPSAVARWELHENGCDGQLVGKYATNLQTFVDSYVESTLDEQTWKCESWRETYCQDFCQNYQNNNNNGGNNNNNKQACSYDCFLQSKNLTGTDMSSCASSYAENDDEEFELQTYLFCDQIKNNNANYNGASGQSTDYTQCYNANANWDGVFRAGAYCASDGYSVYLGVFCDDRCSIKASTSIYSELNNGVALPYSTKTLVPKGDCLACVDAETQYKYEQKAQQNGGNNNQNGNANNWNNMEPRDFCIESYQASVKCEEASSSIAQYLTYGVTTSGCTFLEEYIPAAAEAEAASTRTVYRRQKNAAKPLAWIFACTTLLLGSYAYFLHRKTKRGTVAGLAAREGGMA